jgi:hypothetical protein
MHIYKNIYTIHAFGIFARKFIFKLSKEYNSTWDLNPKKMQPICTLNGKEIGDTNHMNCR